MAVWIEIDLCNGCGLCIKVCPYDAVELRKDKGKVLERCTSCGACLEVCKQEAIFTDREPREIPDFSDRKGIWVFAEQREGRLSRVSMELLGKARELGNILNEEVSAILLGFHVKKLADELFEYGADNVYIAEHDQLKDYLTLPYTKVLEELVRQEKPNIFLMGATHVGRDLAPRLSRRVGVGLTADCTELSIDPEDGILLQTRPAFGGNIMATIENRYSRPQMATLRPGVMETLKEPGKKGKVVIHRVSLAREDMGVELLDKVKEKKKPLDLAEARIIVAGGKGVGGAEGFDMLKGLAGILNGEVAGTRAAVEEGWIPSGLQIGQTGQSVRPELYIACGISGAIQHRAGMQNSRYVIAVNKDPRAPIFQVTDWGIVGDLHDVVPRLIEELESLHDEGVGSIE